MYVLHIVYILHYIHIQILIHTLNILLDTSTSYTQRSKLEVDN
jgi:hypothetical protein